MWYEVLYNAVTFVYMAIYDLEVKLVLFFSVLANFLLSFNYF